MAPSRNTRSTVADLARRRTHLEIGAGMPARLEIASDTVGSDPMAVVLRAGHPLAEEELTMQRFAAASHVTISRRGRLRGPVDEELARHGLHRRVIVALPTGFVALDLVAASDVVTLIEPRRRNTDALDKPVARTGRFGASAPRVCPRTGR